MIKKNHNDNLFSFLNWILKKTSKNVLDTPPSTFIVNRWLSMADNSLAKIVNVTLNRWLYKTQLFRDIFFPGKFYRVFLPKINKKFSYIKRVTKENQDEDSFNILISNSMELSQREIILYNKTLEELNLKVK